MAEIVVEAAIPEGDRWEKLRQSPRRSYRCFQSIAPCDRPPTFVPRRFIEVECRDISSGGLSYYSDKPVDYRSLVVALGKPEEPIYVAAEVVRVLETRRDGRTVFLIGCRFTHRVMDAEGTESPSPDQGSPALAAILQRIGEVSTIPEMATEMLRTVGDPNASLADVAALFSQDPALATRVLRLVNSSAFGITQRVANLEQAVAILGARQLRDLVMAVAISHLFRSSENFGQYSRVGLWRHMVAVGACSRLIARSIGIEPIEDIFLMGLLHDFGIVLEDQYVHQPFCRLLRDLNPAQSLVEQERQHLGFDHASLGAHVAEKMKFPPVIRKSIQYHHNALACQDEDRQAVRCVHLANVICTLRGYFSVHREVVQPVSPQELELPLTDKAVPSIGEELDEEIAKSAYLFQL